MTNEERRASANLMLMCYPHHRITNDVLRYSADGLHRMKAAHELRFSGPDRLLHERVAKEKLVTLVGAGALGGAAFSDIVRAFKHLLTGDKAETPTGAARIPPRRDLVQCLRLAPVGVVQFYSRDPLHSAVGDQFLSIFRAAGWALEQINDPQSTENENLSLQKAMLLVFEIGKAAQLYNAQQAIHAFFDACGFTMSEAEQPVERVEAGHRLRFYITVQARSQ